MNSRSTVLADLVRRWQPGWGACRGLRRATETSDALYVTLALPGRHTEIFALNADDDPTAIERLSSEATQSPKPAWLTVFTVNRESTTEKLNHAGLELVSEPETLMSIDMRRQTTHAAPEPYVVATSTEGSPFRAVATLPDGEVAASGDMAIVGGDAVAHQIRTDPQHRRRGLASAIMTGLAQQAIAAGATTGLLIASESGAGLYTALGWRSHATVLSARPVITG